MAAGVVDFDIDKFREAYPVFSTISDGEIMYLWRMAQLKVNNTPCSPISNLNEREIILWLWMAHAAALQVNQNNGNNGVGRISSATEGSVSVSLDYGAASNRDKWYNQTQYGATFWQMIKPYLGFVYIKGEPPMPVQRTYGLDHAWR